jgi:hypothetical protein
MAKVIIASAASDRRVGRSRFGMRFLLRQKVSMRAEPTIDAGLFPRNSGFFGKLSLEVVAKEQLGEAG